MSVELPHFAAQFEIGRTGATLVEQDTPDDVAACVFRVASCPIGFREDLPEFGIPGLAFQALPLNIAALESAILRWESRANLQLTEQVEAAIEAVQIAIAVS